MGVMLGFQTSIVREQNLVIIEKEFENKRLDKLIKEKKTKSDSIQKLLKDKLEDWRNNPTTQIIERIKIKYEKVRDTVAIDHNQQFDIFSNWLPK